MDGLSDAASPALCLVDAELRADVVERLELAIQRMHRFLAREEIRAKGAADATSALAQSLCGEARLLLDGDFAPGASAPEESTLRSAYRLIGMLGNLAAWSAPAAQESCAINSFPRVAARDVVAYARYGCAETAAQENLCAGLLGFDEGSRVLLTSSGMAAYGLIESFLLREVLTTDDRVLLHPGVYFETQEQVRALRGIHVIGPEGPGCAQLLAAMAAHAPRVVFIDPLTNTADLRLFDLPQLLSDADDVCTGETWFVIDGTLLSGGFDPFAGPERRNVRVLYYESGCKYLQFGLDLGPAGLVAVETRLAARFERLRRGLGCIAPESLVLPRASRTAYLAYLGAQTASAEAAACGLSRASLGETSVIDAVFPTLPRHRDRVATSCYPHCGGVLVFRFHDARLNRRAPLEAFIDLLMDAARECRLPLTAGVSFGFRLPRIGAAWSSYDADVAFLRLSAGVEPQRARRLGELIGTCALEFAAATTADG